MKNLLGRTKPSSVLHTARGPRVGHSWRKRMQLEKLLYQMSAKSAVAESAVGLRFFLRRRNLRILFVGGDVAEEIVFFVIFVAKCKFIIALNFSWRVLRNYLKQARY